ncbi:HTH domain-containing protein [archaeon]|jgi:DNA-binding MarR family transcriptional regulator|nr:HTH domain-containing protein [archaeon]MBT7128977.1 HTH domain-containing protein [archaeon]
MDPIKEAFNKIKEDILLLKNEINNLNKRLNEVQTTPTHNQPISTQQTNKPTDYQTTPTHNQPIQPLYIQNIPISTGNQGVPTNKPTHTQTNQHTHNTPNLDFKQVNNILDSLDTIKKEIRFKFKRLTPQEMLIFGTLYTLENQNNIEITYKIIALELKLSESSIRDYINKLIKKGIPIEKSRKNNKTIILKISQDLKNITNLSTIQSLRAL